MSGSATLERRRTSIHRVFPLPDSMTIPPPPHRTLWEDRFRRPDPLELVEAVPKHLVAVAIHAREQLGAADGVVESLVWHGVWKWTFTYAAPTDGGRAWVYVIPDPARLRMCVPFAAELMQQLPIRKLPKYLRDGLIHAPQVGTMKWPTWELQGKGQFDECLTFALARLKPVAG